jgi:cyclopropane-fatty-acyl-phospholipid synthase
VQTASEGPLTNSRVVADEAARSSPEPHFAPDGGTPLGPSSVEGRLLRTLLAAFGNPPLEIVLWNGERVRSAADPVASMHVADRGTLLRLCADPDLQFGEGYAAGKIEVEGDFERLLEALYHGSGAGSNSISVARRFAQWRHRRRLNTLNGSRLNIHHHYDIGNEFYSLWLGSTMAYTCAYFPTPDATLDEAQVAKMDHVCRKVRLKPGERVVEAGCGWGGLALHMARHYGVKVRAFNISKEQIAFARERAKAQGLDRDVEFVEDDYRNITGTYDTFVSVGMLEHVGVENYPELGRVIQRSLKPDGLGLIHSIGRNYAKPMHRWIDRRIFPGANPAALKQMMDIFEGCNFSVLDVENLRLHYARTLDWWQRLYERSRDHVAHMFDERFVRMWRLYLLGSKAAFTAGELQLFQIVFSPGGNNRLPWTRADIYTT